MAFITSYSQINKKNNLNFSDNNYGLVEIFFKNLLVVNEQNFLQPTVFIVLFQRHVVQEKLEIV